MPAPPRLLVPEYVWQTTLELLGPYARVGVEAGLYWYGVRTTDVALATVVGIPRQENHPHNFEVHAEDLASLIRAVQEPLVVVAQLHTHPGSGTRHSDWDDRLVVSRRILSIVLPHYGRDASLEAAGVHEFLDDRWQRLNPRLAAERIIVTTGSVDGRL